VSYFIVNINVTAQVKVLGDQPFCNEAMINTLHQSLFDGKNSIGVQSNEDFVWVLDGNDELELPIAMVALIATVVGFLFLFSRQILTNCHSCCRSMPY
jgi:hypothetical protein